MARIIEGLGEAGLQVVLDPGRGGRYPATHAFGALVRIILGQQVSVAAARSMVERLVARYDGALPTPGEVLADDPEALRQAAALSRAKLRSIVALAADVESGRVDLEALDRAGDDEVLARLCAVTGIGPWTAHVYLMGHLRRPDVLAPGDLGIRRAAGLAYAADGAPVTPAQLIALAEPWRPHRSTACRVLWTSLAAPPT